MNYYNEHDPKAAAWLRELINSGEIPPGEVDERDIQNVKPTELIRFTQCHFFAGIGGWSYALRLAGWPEDRPVWTGSCPCQPFSVAGKGICEDDERHLWPDFRNLIGECRPAVVFGEQVASADGRTWLAGVSANLEALAYRFCAADLCAAGIGSPGYRGAEACYRCEGTGIYDRHGVVLKRYELGGLIFHEPANLVVSIPRDEADAEEWLDKHRCEYRHIITGRIKHPAVPVLRAEMAFLALLFAFAPEQRADFFNLLVSIWWNRMQPAALRRIKCEITLWFERNKMPEGYGSPEYWPQWLQDMQDGKDDGIPF